MLCRHLFVSSFSFNFYITPTTTVIYTLSLHDALPISPARPRSSPAAPQASGWPRSSSSQEAAPRSEEHTSELQSRPHLVCRLLLEKKNIILKLSVHDGYSSTLYIYLYFSRFFYFLYSY